ncbi:MAG TPA: O-acetyl-ADP-ribose deacetylase [Steroidobacteraceae bacterium]|nr:O-acetyl-ADP-ribose deacetylase [Steroidobacteraceae bacterium]
MATSPSHLRLVHGDITTLDLDAIVNAANSSLLGGGGVDGAIHRAGGPQLLQACRQLGGCDVGDAKLTPGFRLKARHVIHTVGPVWRGGGRGEAQLLAACYRRCLQVAAEHRLQSIAFPSISTGAYGFPRRLAAPIAIAAAQAPDVSGSSVHEVIYCCFSHEDFEIYRELLRCGAG